MADLDLIELLNGIDVSSERQRPAFGNSSEVFLDDNGHPTDRFLQSLRENSTTKKNSFAQYNDNSWTRHEDSDSSSISSSYESLRGERSSRRKLKSKPKYPQRQNLVSNKTRKSGKPSTPKKDAHIKKVHVVSSTNLDYNGVGPVAASSNVSKDVQHIIESTENLNGEMISQIKSLKLRLQGQIHTIRSLESQLSDANKAISGKDGQLAEIQRKLSTLETRERERGGRLARDGKVATAALTARCEGGGSLVQQLKLDVRSLTQSLKEEADRRLRTEERLHLTKTHLGKLKDQNELISARVESLAVENAELQQRNHRQRGEHKDLQEAVRAERDSCHRVQADLEEKIALIDKLDASTRELSHSNLQQQEELQWLRSELAGSQDKLRRNQLELEICKERLKTVKAAEHYSAVTRPPPNPAPDFTAPTHTRTTRSGDDPVERSYSQTDVLSNLSFGAAEVVSSGRDWSKGGGRDRNKGGDRDRDREWNKGGDRDRDRDWSKGGGRDRNKGGDRDWDEDKGGDRRSRGGGQAGYQSCSSHRRAASADHHRDPVSASTGANAPYNRLQQLYERVVAGNRNIHAQSVFDTDG